MPSIYRFGRNCWIRMRGDVSYPSLMNLSQYYILQKLRERKSVCIRIPGCEKCFQCRVRELKTSWCTYTTKWQTIVNSKTTFSNLSSNKSQKAYGNSYYSGDSPAFNYIFLRRLLEPNKAEEFSISRQKS